MMAFYIVSAYWLSHGKQLINQSIGQNKRTHHSIMLILIRSKRHIKCLIPQRIHQLKDPTLVF